MTTPFRLTHIKVEQLRYHIILFDATQAPTTIPSKREKLSIPRFHELIQSHIIDCVRISHEDPHDGISDEFLRFQASR